MEARAHQFEDAQQQRDAATLGMWVFLSTEILFFGAMLLGLGWRLHKRSSLHHGAAPAS